MQYIHTRTYLYKKCSTFLIIFCRVISTIFDVIRVHRPFWKCLQYQGLLEGPDGMHAPPDLPEKEMPVR